MEILTIIISIVLGLPAVLVYIKNKKTKIFYFHDQQISLKNDLMVNRPDLQITYKNQPINDKLTSVRGKFICSGSADIIDKNNFIELLSKDVNWLDFKIISKSRGFDVSSEFNGEAAIIKFDQFKTNEFIEFEGLFETKSKEYNPVKFYHRIPNIGAIKTINSNFKLFSIIYSVALIILTLMATVFIFFVPKYTSVNVESYHSQTSKIFDENSLGDNIWAYQVLVSKLNIDYRPFELYFKKSQDYDLGKIKILENGKAIPVKNIDKSIKIYFKGKFSLSFFSYILFFILFSGYFIYFSSMLIRMWNYRNIFQKTKNLQY